MPDSKPWQFKQIGGPKKSIVLAGLSAPHGRPRATPVVEEEMGLRDTAVYYPGARRPTRHLFGEIHTDWTLTGRFSDAFLGPGGARARVQEIKEFIADQQAVRIAWGDILAATGIVRRIKAARESEAEIVWTLIVGIDGDDALPPRGPAAPRVPSLDAGKLTEGLGALDALPPDIPLPSSLTEALGSLASQITSVTSVVVDVAHGIDNFERAAAGELNRLRAGIRQLETAYVELSLTLESAEADFALGASSARGELAWHSARAEAAATAFAMCAMLADLGRGLDVIDQGDVETVHRAILGETWESIATRYYGGPKKASVLRKANDARYGVGPAPGRLVRIPSA